MAWIYENTWWWQYLNILDNKKLFSHHACYISFGQLWWHRFEGCCFSLHCDHIHFHLDLDFFLQYWWWESLFQRIPNILNGIKVCTLWLPSQRVMCHASQTALLLLEPDESWHCHFGTTNKEVKIRWWKKLTTQCIQVLLFLQGHITLLNQDLTNWTKPRS